MLEGKSNGIRHIRIVLQQSPISLTWINSGNRLVRAKLKVVLVVVPVVYLCELMLI